MSKILEDQTKNAFEFVQKLYFEISYLIKEIEGLLQHEAEEFVIGRPSGYGVTSRTSTGLEPVNVEIWLPKTFTVFFCPRDMTQTVRGQTVTPFSDDLKLVLLHIELVRKHLNSPRILGGCIWNIRRKRPSQHKKFEQLMWEFAYNPGKIFASLPNVSYDDSYIAFDGKFIEKSLFSIKNSGAVMEEIVVPILAIYSE